MTHEFEAGMFVSQPAWHGLGTVLDAPPTVQDAIIASGLGWDVGLRHLAIMGTSTEVDAMATVRESDGKVLGVVGTGYRVLQNSKAFQFFQPFVDSGECTIEAAGSLRGGKHVWVLAKIQSRPIEIVKDDAVEPYILLSNSHDGSRMIRAGFTMTRVVCQNTLTAAHNAGGLIRIRHTKNAELALDEVRETMDVINRQFKADTDQMKRLAMYGCTESDLKEYVHRVFRTKEDAPEAAPSLGASSFADLLSKPAKLATQDRLYDRIRPLFDNGRGQSLPGVPGTYWAAYNAVTEYLTHEKGASQDTRLESVWLGESNKLGQRALEVASEMCAR